MSGNISGQSPVTTGTPTPTSEPITNDLKAEDDTQVGKTTDKRTVTSETVDPKVKRSAEDTDEKTKSTKKRLKKRTISESEQAPKKKKSRKAAGTKKAVQAKKNAAAKKLKHFFAQIKRVINQTNFKTIPKSTTDQLKQHLHHGHEIFGHINSWNLKVNRLDRYKAQGLTHSEERKSLKKSLSETKSDLKNAMKYVQSMDNLDNHKKKVSRLDAQQSQDSKIDNARQSPQTWVKKTKDDELPLPPTQDQLKAMQNGATPTSPTAPADDMPVPPPPPAPAAPQQAAVGKQPKKPPVDLTQALKSAVSGNQLNHVEPNRSKSKSNPLISKELLESTKLKTHTEEKKVVPREPSELELTMQKRADRLAKKQVSDETKPSGSA